MKYLAIQRGRGDPPRDRRTPLSEHVIDIETDWNAVTPSRRVSYRLEYYNDERGD